MAIVGLVGEISEGLEVLRWVEKRVGVDVVNGGGIYGEINGGGLWIQVIEMVAEGGG